MMMIVTSHRFYFSGKTADAAMTFFKIKRREAGIVYNTSRGQLVNFTFSCPPNPPKSCEKCCGSIFVRTELIEEFRDTDIREKHIVCKRKHIYD